jgi:hypothetical protein
MHLLMGNSLHTPQQFNSDFYTLGLYHVAQFFTGSSWLPVEMEKFRLSDGMKVNT